MHEVAAVDLGFFFQPKEIFNQPDKIDPADLSNDKTTPNENH